MNIRKLLGIPSTSDITNAVIKELDEQVLLPLLQRVDSQIAKAKQEVIIAVKSEVNNIESILNKKAIQIKQSSTESINVFKMKAVKKAEKKIDDGIQKVRNLLN